MTFQPGGATVTPQNPVFSKSWTNGRTCFSCHQPQNGWTVSAASVQARFYASFGTDPIFRLVDGATCPTDDVSSIEAKHQAYSLLLGKGLIRIGLSVPVTAEYRIVSVIRYRSYGCNTNPVTGLTNFGPSGPTTGTVSIYACVFSYRFHSYLNRFESLESLKFSDFFCGALDRNVIRS
jgi:cytochrome c peroxidase